MNPVVRKAAAKELGDCDRIHIIESLDIYPLTADADCYAGRFSNENPDVVMGCNKYI